MGLDCFVGVTDKCECKLAKTGQGPHSSQLSDDFFTQLVHCCGLGSIVGIATGYGLDGLGIESR